MRCLFTMFAEDVGLLPKDCFAELLKQQKETPQTFPRALEQFWGIMDKGGYALHLNATIKRFNGTLFKDTTALPLDAEGIHELWVAASRDWSDEPSISDPLGTRPRRRSSGPCASAASWARTTPRAPTSSGW